jgi:peptidoglycan hydrolase CwlO-like protein
MLDSKFNTEISQTKDKISEVSNEIKESNKKMEEMKG